MIMMMMNFMMVVRILGGGSSGVWGPPSIERGGRQPPSGGSLGQEPPKIRQGVWGEQTPRRAQSTATDFTPADVPDPKI